MTRFFFIFLTLQMTVALTLLSCKKGGRNHGESSGGGAPSFPPGPLESPIPVQAVTQKAVRYLGLWDELERLRSDYEREFADYRLKKENQGPESTVTELFISPPKFPRAEIMSMISTLHTARYDFLNERRKYAEVVSRSGIPFGGKVNEEVDRAYLLQEQHDEKLRQFTNEFREFRRR